jgi:hypothetical protein
MDRDNDGETEDVVEAEEEEETSFTEGNRIPDESILVPVGYNPDIDGSRPVKE